MLRTAVLLALPWLAVAGVRAAFTIDITYDTAATVQERAGVTFAKSFWESRLTGYAGDYGLDGLTLYVSTGSYASAVSGYVTATNGVQGGVYTAETGELRINSASVASMVSAGTYNTAVARAVGFALGFGDTGGLDRLWTVNGLTSSSTTYTGAYALAAYRSEFGLPGAAAITISGSTWNQSGLTNDLMSANPDLATATLSATSLQAFRDLGYTVTAVPEASPLIVATALSPALMLLRRRRNRSAKA